MLNTNNSIYLQTCYASDTMLSPLYFLRTLFIYGRSGSLLFCEGFPLAVASRAPLPCNGRASHCSGFSCPRAQAPGGRASGAAALGLSRCSSEALEHGLSCPKACGIFPDLGLNPCPLHWQADSYPLGHQRIP